MQLLNIFLTIATKEKKIKESGQKDSAALRQGITCAGQNKFLQNIRQWDLKHMADFADQKLEFLHMSEIIVLMHNIIHRFRFRLERFRH